MRLPRVVIAAPKSGSGKTLVSIALMKALSLRGKKVSAFKCGPDYIDPLFHKKILDVPSKNLDLFFTDEATTRRLFCDGNESDISIIEGVMGLFDGVAGYTDEASTYQLASVLESPVILVVNAKGAGRSVVAEIKGFVALDEKKLIKGVILNNLPESLYDALKPLIEDECGVSVLGFVPTMKELNVESRYLGLTLPDEIADIKKSVEKVAEAICKIVSIDEIVDVAEKAPSLTSCSEADNQDKPDMADMAICAPKDVTDDVPRVRIAVARDEAFCFYYDDNLKLLERFGAELVPFSPVADSSLPPDIDGLLLGGGYPELHAEKLEQNVSMRRAVKAAVESGMPSVAECGGFMYLHERIQTEDGVFHSMVGAIKGECSYKGRAVRFGYCTVTENTGAFLGNGGCAETQVSEPETAAQLETKVTASAIKAHEFHYFDSSACGESCTAEKPVTGKSWQCCHTSENHWWGFPHLYYPSNPCFAERFVAKCRAYRKSRPKNYKFFQNRACEMFPCHKTDDIDNFNCLFCFCPLYFSGEKCGGNFHYTAKGRKSCVDCTFPHKKENYDELMAKLRSFIEKGVN